MTEFAKHLLVCALSVAIPVGWFLWCVAANAAVAAGHGAGIGLAITLGFLFIYRDYGTRLYAAFRDTVPDLERRIKALSSTDATRTQQPDVTLEMLERRIDVLSSAISIDGKGHTAGSYFLAAATLIGTLISSFGEVWATSLIKYLTATP